ncbi:hypothetical protein NMY22_g15461 [Coprinellus aureogranulatus]|nr:hypothetical protein NMY22_g15461 [Coprinellus aureogranulatus]
MTSHIAPVIEFEGAASASDAQGASGNFISMDSLIRKLSKGLPLLEELYLRPSLAFLRNRGTNNWGDLEEAGLAEFLQLLEGVDLSEDAARCSFTIAAGRGRGSSSIDLHFNREIGRATLQALRLVSKTMNSVAGPELFDELYISFNQNSPLHIVDQLGMAAVGKGPNVQWTKMLFILDLVEEHPSIDGDETPHYPHRDAFLRCQTTVLMSAILAMKGIRYAVVDLEEEVNRCLDILGIVKDLPLLELLSIHSAEEYLDSDVPLSILSQFKSLQSFQLQVKTLFPETVVAIQRLIEQSPELSILSILQLDSSADSGEAISLMDFDRLLPPPPSPSALIELTLTKEHVRLTAASAPFFRSLTHLHIRECGIIAEPGFWSALEENGVALRALSVYPLSPSLIKFLLSFTGLVEIFIHSGSYDHATDKTRQYQEDFFHRVLPHHRHTLEAVFLGPQRHNAWALTNAFLDQVLLCSSLRELSLTSHVVPVIEGVVGSTSDSSVGAAFISMDSLLTKAAKGLPELRGLNIFPSLAFIDSREMNEFDTPIEEEGGLKEFLQLLEGVDLSEHAEHCKFRLTASRGAAFFKTLRFDRDAGRFVAPLLEKTHAQRTGSVHGGSNATVSLSLDSEHEDSD